MSVPSLEKFLEQKKKLLKYSFAAKIDWTSPLSLETVLWRAFNTKIDLNMLAFREDLTDSLLRERKC